MATAPRPGSTARDATPSITITIDDQPYTLHPGELSALDVSAARRATREVWGEPVSVQRLLTSVLAGTDETLEPDIDAIAVIVWLARRQNGDPATLSEVMESITFDSEFAVDSEEAQDPDPLSPSASSAAGSSPPSPTTSASDGNTSP